MKARFDFVPAAIGAAVLALTGCGGGGGKATPPAPTPTATVPAFACTAGNSVLSLGRRPAGHQRRPQNLPSQNNPPSTYTFDSNPQGLAVALNGPGIGKTKTSKTPPFSNDPYLVTITGSQAALDVCFSQIADGPHTIYYNSLADTNGQISIGAAAKARPDSVSPLLLSRLAKRFPNRPTTLREVPNRIEVLYDAAFAGTDMHGAIALERAEGAPRAHSIGPVTGGIAMRIVSVPAGTSASAFAARMKQHAGVRDVHVMHYRELQSSTPVNPNDQFFTTVAQWDMFHISMPNAWGYTQGSPSIPIAIVDTGADLTGQQELQPVSPSGKIRFEESVINGVRDTSPTAAQDEDGHGTNVSGIAAEDTNNNFGFAGTGFNVSLQEYRVFPYSSGGSNPGASPDDEAQAIYDAVDSHGARVVNLSLGSCEAPGPDPIELAAIEHALAKGVVVAAAAGNERAGGGASPCQTGNAIDFPAAYPGVIAVGASALNDTANPSNPTTAIEYVASYSNSGPGLAVVAPGGDPGPGDNGSQVDSLHWITNIYSTTGQQISGINPCPNPGQLCAILIAGTSQATPHVSGTAALMLSKNGSLSPAQIRSIIQATADNINDPNQGRGRLNAYRALAVAANDPNPPFAPQALNFVAIAYNGGTNNKPSILNATFTSGVPVNSDGTFRVPDVPANAPAYKIGLWYDANGNGVLDAGDWFGSAGPCNASSPCGAAASIAVTRFNGGPIP